MKKNKSCKGGSEHPTKPGLLCWGNHDPEDEGHWCYIQVSGELRRISWRD